MIKIFRDRLFADLISTHRTGLYFFSNFPDSIRYFLSAAVINGKNDCSFVIFRGESSHFIDPFQTFQRHFFPLTSDQEPDFIFNQCFIMLI